MQDPTADRVDPALRRGRGAATNRTGRFETETRVAFDDGWGEPEDAPPPIRTEVTIDRARRIITRNTSPDLNFDRSINPYRGCEHGCVYCFARPTHAYLGLSPGLDFETRIFAKPNAAKLLEKELSNPNYTPAPIAIGTSTDPYQPIERERRIMRQVLEVLRDFNHPVAIVTKGALVTRDADILGPMGKAGLARVSLSLTTLDHRLSRRMEPRAASPLARLRAMTTLAEAGCPVGALIAPVIPAINDHEIERLLEAARNAGARRAGYVTLRMPLEIKDLFRDWLQEHYPDRARRVLGVVREMHGGKDYDPEWGKRLKGEGVQAALIKTRFAAAARRLGLEREDIPLRSDLFRPPVRQGDQLSFEGF